MSELKVEIEGLKELQAKMDQTIRDLHGPPMLGAMREATLIVTRSARQNAPVDTGRLRASITPEVRVRDQVLEGVVGSNLVYSPYMELGTGTFVGRPRHWPPASALEVWARRHGFASGYVVARIIGLRGGLRPLRYLQRALEDNAAKIFRLLGRVVAQITAK